MNTVVMIFAGFSLVSESSNNQANDLYDKLNVLTTEPGSGIPVSIQALQTFLYMLIYIIFVVIFQKSIGG